MAKILSGKELSKQIKEELAERIALLKNSYNRAPGLAVIIVGENPASMSYVRSKRKVSHQLGIRSFDYNLPETVSESALLEIIDQLNGDPAVDGILVQLPLPDHIDDNKVLLKISPEKDVDGFHPVSLGRMLIGLDTFFPCTPYGIVQIISRSGIETTGKHVCIVGRSNIVGKPLANLLIRKEVWGNATVTVCHSRTVDIEKHIHAADIVVAAIGKAEFVTGDMIREGAVVIDVGINRVEDPSRERGYRLVGDVDFASASEKASAITPVPGGVGPMTITMLMYNTVLSAERTLTGRKGE